MPQPGFFTLLREQLNPPPLTRADLTGKVVIVVGANVGIGFEAAKHFATMNPAKLILGCRVKEKGEAALAKIKEATGCKTAEVWTIDLLKFSSVKAFVENFANEEERLDIVVLNAGLSASALQYTDDGWEATYQVNYLSTCFLALLLVPRLLRTADQYGTTPRLTLVGSGSHYFVKSLDSEKVMSAPNALKLLGHKDYFPERMGKTYQGRIVYAKTKVMGHFFVRALSERLATKPLIVSSSDPGMCATEIGRNYNGLSSYIFAILYRTIGRTPEEGSRPIVWATIGGGDKKDEIRGGFVNTVAKVDSPSDYITSEKGHAVQDKLWDNIIEELSKAEPKVQKIVEEILGPSTSSKSVVAA